MRTDYEGFEAEVYFLHGGEGEVSFAQVLPGCPEGRVVAVRIYEDAS